MSSFVAGGPDGDRVVDIEFHSFEPAPDLPLGPTQTVLRYDVDHKGMGESEAATLLTRVTARGRTVGLDLDLDSALLTHTSRAHQLIHHAKAHGRQLEAVHDDETLARSLGISSVPFFVVDVTYAVAGVQGTATVTAALERACSETPAAPLA